MFWWPTQAALFATAINIGSPAFEYESPEVKIDYIRTEVQYTAKQAWSDLGMTISKGWTITVPSLNSNLRATVTSVQTDAELAISNTEYTDLEFVNELKRIISSVSSDEDTISEIIEEVQSVLDKQTTDSREEDVGYVLGLIEEVYSYNDQEDSFEELLQDGAIKTLITRFPLAFVWRTAAELAMLEQEQSRKNAALYADFINGIKIETNDEQLLKTFTRLKTTEDALRFELEESIRLKSEISDIKRQWLERKLSINAMLDEIEEAIASQKDSDNAIAESTQNMAKNLVRLREMKQIIDSAKRTMWIPVGG